LFDKLGRDAALPKVVALKIKENTARSWFRSFAAKKSGRLIPMTEDFRIELTHSSDRLLSWTWATYDPRNVEDMMHAGGQRFGGNESAACKHDEQRAAHHGSPFCFYQPTRRNSHET
jgi:hypothetical protein